MIVTIPPQHFVQGAVLEPDALNRAFYDTGQGEGLYSEANGGLDSGNLDPDFRLQQDHMQPEQVVKSRFGGSWTTLDQMSDVSGSTLELTSLTIPAAQALTGCGVRVHVPFAATAIRWNMSWFWYVSRWFGLDKATVPATPSSQAQEVRTHVFVDGVEIEALRREYPLTWFQRAPEAMVVAPGGKAPWSTQTEQASVINLSYLQSAGDQQYLSAGFHEVFVGFYVKPVNVSYFRNTVRKSQINGFTSKSLKLHQRWSTGCRSARVVAML